VGVLLFSTTALLPSFMQNLLGYSATQAGVASVTRGLGSLVSFLLVPMAMVRLGPRTCLFLGLILCVCGLWMMGGFSLEMTSGPILISGFVQGLGIGLLFSPLSTLAYVTLDPSHRVEGTVVSTMVRSLGSSVGISIVMAAVLRNSAGAHSELAGRIDPSSPLLRYLLPPLMDPRSEVGAQILNGEITRQSAMIGYANIFMWMALVTCVILPAVILLRPARAPPSDKVEIHTE
jgi:MFS transporter, DHA2 family, multidrug resistance protein